MKQRVTRAVFDYWNSLRGARTAPDRCDIDPGAIRACLADTFILTFDPKRGHPFRIAGTSLCDMFGSELTHKPFGGLWAADQQAAMSDLIRAVGQENCGVIAGVTGQNAAGDMVELEMILLPLTSSDIGTGRILGAMTAVSAPYWLGARPLQSLRLGELRYINARGKSRLASSQRVVHGRGFAVYPAATTAFHEMVTANPPLTPLE